MNTDDAAMQTAAADATPSQDAGEELLGAAASETDEELSADQRIPVNTFALETALAICMVLDVKGGLTANKTNVQLYSSNNTDAQRWVLEWCREGFYIVNIKSGKVLDVAGGKAVSGTNVQIYTKNATKAQLWLPESSADGGWILRSLLGNDLVLYVANNKSASGANICVQSLNGKKGQIFYFREINPGINKCEKIVENGTYYLKTGKSASVTLTVAGSTAKKSSNIQIETFDRDFDQRFILAYKDGYYTITHALSGLVLDVAGGSPMARTNVRLWNSNNTAAQQWVIERTSDGYYCLTNRGTGLVLAIDNGSTKSGTNVWGYYDRGTSAQTWRIERIEMIAEGFYTLSDNSTGKVLDITNGAYDSGTRVQRYKSNGTMEQKYYIAPSEYGDSYVIWSVHSGLRLNVSGTKVVQSTASGATATWMIVKKSGGYVFVNAAGKLAFDSSNKAIVSSTASGNVFSIGETDAIAAGSTFQFKSLAGTVVDVKDATSKSLAVSATSTGQASQLWKVTKGTGDFEGSYVFTNKASGLVLGLVTIEGNYLQQAKDKGQLKQHWYVKWDTSRGGFVLENYKTGDVLDMENGSSAAGTLLVTAEANSSKTQAWRLLIESKVASSGTSSSSSSGGSSSAVKTTLSVAERIAEVAYHYATHEVHGYNQYVRLVYGTETFTFSDNTTAQIDAGDIDCSTMVLEAVCAALNIERDVLNHEDGFYTGNEIKRLEGIGFDTYDFDDYLYGTLTLKKGDILWIQGHTVVYMGDGLQAEANINELGLIYGGQKGDQHSLIHGDEVRITNLSYRWDTVIRYNA